MLSLLEVESIFFPAEAESNKELGQIIRHIITLYGADIAAHFFRSVRARAKLMNVPVWPPTNLVPLTYVLLDLFSMVTNSTERCQNCHAADHPGSCPLFPTTVELDPGMGIPPPRSRGKGSSPPRRVSFQQGPRSRSPAPAARSKKRQGTSSPRGPPPPPPPPPPSTPPPAKCRYGKKCQNQRNGCLFSH